MISFMIFIWVIGWLVHCGIIYVLFKDDKFIDKLKGYYVSAIFWPFLTGVIISMFLMGAGDALDKYRNFK